MSPRPAYSRDGAGQLRIGDAERDRAAADLAEHYAQGRLDRDEHAERLDRIWAARTRADLEPVFADLPGHAPAGPPPATVARRRGRGLPGPLLVLLVVLAMVTVLAHLPLILVGLGVWLLLVRGGCRQRHWTPARHW